MGKIRIFLLAILFLAAWINASAQTVVLKNGQRVEGKITEQTDKYIKMQFEGVEMVFYKEEIASIEEGKAEEVALDKNIVTPQMGSLYKSYLQSLNVPLSGKKETAKEAKPAQLEEPAANEPQSPEEVTPYATAVAVSAVEPAKTSNYREYQKKKQEEKKNASDKTAVQGTPAGTPAAKATPVKITPVPRLSRY